MDDTGHTHDVRKLESLVEYAVFLRVETFALH